MVVAPSDDVAGEVAEPSVVGAGVAAQQGEGLGDVEPAAFGEDPAGLFDDHPAVQGHL